MNPNQKTFLIPAIAFAALLPLLQGCASTAVEKKIDVRVDQETIQTRADLNKETDDLIRNTPDLNDDQRAKLITLRDRTQVQAEEIRENSLKLRAVLVHDMVAKNYDENEVELIKTRIRKLERERLDIFFKAVEQANTILGRQAFANGHIIDSFIEIGGRLR